MSSWSVPLDRLAQRAQAQFEDVARKATYDLFRAVVLKSPVDTGRFRSNWNVTASVPSFTYSESTNVSRADSETLKALTLPVGGVVYLSNGLPYANRLEYGYSNQAPSGMIRTSVADFNRFVDRALA